MSPKPDLTNYDTEDEESVLEQNGEQKVYAEILKTFGIVEGANEKSKVLDRDMLLALVELKKLETRKEIEQLKHDNLDRVDSIFAKLSYSNLPPEVILRLIDNPVHAKDSGLERLSRHARKQYHASCTSRINSQENSPSRVTTTTVQITPPRTEHQQSLTSINSRRSSQSLPHISNQRSIPPQTQHTLAMVPSLDSRYSSNGGMKYYCPTSGNMSQNPQNLQYIPSHLHSQMPQQNPESISEHGSMNMLTPAFRYPPPLQPQLATTQLGHKRSHSAMTVPEMSTFIVSRGNQPQFPIPDSAKPSAKVSFLINTPKNPPR